MVESAKSALIKTILDQVTKCLNSSSEDSIISDLSEILNKLHYTKIRSVSNEFIVGSDLLPDKVSDLINAFKSLLSENGNHNFLKRHRSENVSEDNISLSSDDLASDQSDPPFKMRRCSNSRKQAFDSDSDIEIIDDIIEPRKRRTNSSKENIDVNRRYELRDRKNGTKPPMPPKPAETRSKPTRASPAFYDPAEIIQIEDSSDEDVQEIRREPRPTEPPPTQPDPSQLASIPMIVQFPTMQSATFNGHLYISHNHKFSVKLQGIEPRNFRWS